MKKFTEKPEPNEELVKLTYSKRLLLIIVYYIRLGWHDLENAFSYLSHKEKRKILSDNIIHFIRLFYLKTKQESVLKEAASLTYITLLGFIPFLTLLVFIVPKLPFVTNNVALQARVYENFLPQSAGEVTKVISSLVSNRVSFNLFSFILVIITSYSLFKVIRDTFDRILINEYEPHQDLISQLVKFFGTLIIGFFIILLLFSSSSLPIISSLLDFPLFKQQLMLILPFVAQFLALIFLYMLMPSIKIKRSSLFRTAFWTTLIWVVVKGLFDYYIYYLTNMEAVFGVLKSLPIFLFWIYVNWVIILGGMVLAAILEQKDDALDDVEKARHFVRMSLEFYTDKKLDKNLEKTILKNELAQIINNLTEEDQK